MNQRIVCRERERRERERKRERERGREEGKKEIVIITPNISLSNNN